MLQLKDKYVRLDKKAGANHMLSPKKNNLNKYICVHVSLYVHINVFIYKYTSIHIYPYKYNKRTGS